MKIYHKSESRRPRTPFAGALACVLLIGIIYSATFGFVHRHGNVSSEFGTNISASSTQQAISLAKVPFHSRSDGNECLICVLHRQFSSSTVHAPLFIVGPSTQTAFVSAPTAFYYSSLTTSRPIARLSGRAPPQAQA